MVELYQKRCTPLRRINAGFQILVESPIDGVVRFLRRFIDVPIEYQQVSESLFESHDVVGRRHGPETSHPKFQGNIDKQLSLKSLCLQLPFHQMQVSMDIDQTTILISEVRSVLIVLAMKIVINRDRHYCGSTNVGPPWITKPRILYGLFGRNIEGSQDARCTFCGKGGIPGWRTSPVNAVDIAALSERHTVPLVRCLLV
jgi:hypothetical protein